MITKSNKKYCNGCDTFHDITAFGKRTTSSDGLDGNCRAFLREKTRRKKLTEQQKTDTRVLLDNATRRAW